MDKKRAPQQGFHTCVWMISRITEDRDEGGLNFPLGCPHPFFSGAVNSHLAGEKSNKFWRSPREDPQPGNHSSTMQSSWLTSSCLSNLRLTPGNSSSDETVRVLNGGEDYICYKWVIYLKVPVCNFYKKYVKHCLHHNPPEALAILNTFFSSK